MPFLPPNQQRQSTEAKPCNEPMKQLPTDGQTVWPLQVGRYQFRSCIAIKVRTLDLRHISPVRPVHISAQQHRYLLINKVCSCLPVVSCVSVPLGGTDREH